MACVFGEMRTLKTGSRSRWWSPNVRRTGFQDGAWQLEGEMRRIHQFLYNKEDISLCYGLGMDMVHHTCFWGLKVRILKINQELVRSTHSKFTILDSKIQPQRGIF